MAGAWLQFVAGGLTAGAIYALVALGFSIVYNASHAINFAQGEFVMLGGMGAVALVALGLPLVPAVLLAVAGAMIVGLLVQRLALEPAQSGGRADVTTLIIITIGVSLFLRGLAQVASSSVRAELVEAPTRTSRALRQAQGERFSGSA